MCQRQHRIEKKCLFCNVNGIYIGALVEFQMVVVALCGGWQPYSVQAPISMVEVSVEAKLERKMPGAANYHFLCYMRALLVTSTTKRRSCCCVFGQRYRLSRRTDEVRRMSLFVWHDTVKFWPTTPPWDDEHRIPTVIIKSSRCFDANICSSGETFGASFIYLYFSVIQTAICWQINTKKKNIALSESAISKQCRSPVAPSSAARRVALRHSAKTFILHNMSPKIGMNTYLSRLRTTAGGEYAAAREQGKNVKKEEKNVIFLIFRIFFLLAPQPLSRCDGGFYWSIAAHFE